MYLSNSTYVYVYIYTYVLGFPSGSDSKESACNAGSLGLIPGLRRSPGGGHGNPLQYSCPENPIDRGAWWAIVHGVTKSQTRLSDQGRPHLVFSLSLLQGIFPTQGSNLGLPHCRQILY